MQSQFVSRQSLNNTVTRQQVHGNHRVLRNRRVATKSGLATTMSNSAMVNAMNKLGQSLLIGSKMARSNALRISSAAFLVGSYKMIEKYGDSESANQVGETGRLTMF